MSLTFFFLSLKDGIIQVGDDMLKVINSLNLHYQTHGNSRNKPLVFLHGWGQNMEMMRLVAEPLIDNYYIIMLDLPGFGLSEEPKNKVTLDDYVMTIKSLLDDLGIVKPILIGHSFGGKIALLYASKHPTSKLIVFGSPFDASDQSLSLKVKILKKIATIKFLNDLAELMKNYIGSSDYRSATPTMRKVLTSTINTDLTNQVSKINCPTLIVWGSDDLAVPLRKAYELEKLIKDAAVIVYQGASHYAYLENINQTINIIKSFVES